MLIVKLILKLLHFSVRFRILIKLCTRPIIFYCILPVLSYLFYVYETVFVGVWTMDWCDVSICFLFPKLIGSPDDASLGFLRSDNARRYVRQLPQYPRQQFSARFPNNSPGAVDLLEKMLVFDPNRRITGWKQLIFY